MDRRNFTKRGRHHSSPPDLNVAVEPLLKGFDNVAGRGPDKPEFVLYLDIFNSNRGSSNKPDQSPNLFNTTLHSKGDGPLDSDYSLYKDQTRLSVRPKCLRQAYKEKTCKGKSSFEDETTNTTRASTSANKPSENSKVISNASSVIKKAQNRYSTGEKENMEDQSRSTDNSPLPLTKEHSDLEHLSKDLANLKISGTVQSCSEAKSQHFQTSQCVKHKSSTTCTCSNILDRQSALKISATFPAVTLESVATSVGTLITDLHRFYGSKISIVISLSSDYRRLPSLLESLYSSLEALRSHRNSVIMFQIVNERRVALALPKIRKAVLDVKLLIKNYYSGRNCASSQATLALEQINGYIRWLFEDLHPIDNEIQEALSMLEDEWGPTG